MDYNLATIITAFALTLFAGLSTGIGSTIAFFSKHTNTKFLSLALGFSAGVMIYVSFVEIFSKARESLVDEIGLQLGSWVTVASFFGGMAIIALIDKFIPEQENPHEVMLVEDAESGRKRKEKLMRMGIFTALAIAIHNFPEGLATFTSALTNPKLGIAIAVAIAIHNIPEGIAVSV
ncbi:MAG TPA: ZIP family metal transporter, partial [Salinivirgaceae bacterium]|nr:ZIP family metal transporter [Salinivirgaceae bacterium]